LRTRTAPHARCCAHITRSVGLLFFCFTCLAAPHYRICAASSHTLHCCAHAHHFAAHAALRASLPRALYLCAHTACCAPYQHARHAHFGVRALRTHRCCDLRTPLPAAHALRARTAVPLRLLASRLCARLHWRAALLPLACAARAASAAPGPRARSPSARAWIASHSSCAPAAHVHSAAALPRTTAARTLTRTLVARATSCTLPHCLALPALATRCTAPHYAPRTTTRASTLRLRRQDGWIIIGRVRCAGSIVAQRARGSGIAVWRAAALATHIQRKTTSSRKRHLYAVARVLGARCCGAGSIAPLAQHRGHRLRA